MDFHYPQKVKLGLGISQQVGLAARELGSRALIITEASYAGTKELSIITQALERAVVSYLVLERIEGQPLTEFLGEAVTLGRAGFVDTVVAMGNSQLLSLGRAAAMEIPKGRAQGAPVKPAVKVDAKAAENAVIAGRPLTAKPTAGLPYLELPTTHCFPLLLREEGFIGSTHPAEIRFFNAPLFGKHWIFLDPHMTTGLTPRTSVTSHLESLFFAVEALFQDTAGLTEESLLLGAAGHLWSNLKNIFENPANVQFRHESFQAGLNIAIACSLLPRAAGLSACFVLGGVASLPPSALGSAFLAPFLETFAPKNTVRLKKLAQVMNVSDFDGTDETLAQKLAQEVRKFLNQYSLPMRLRDFKLVESEISLTADVIKGLGIRRGGMLDADNLPAFLKSVY